MRNKTDKDGSKWQRMRRQRTRRIAHRHTTQEEEQRFEWRRPHSIILFLEHFCSIILFILRVGFFCCPVSPKIFFFIHILLLAFELNCHFLSTLSNRERISIDTTRREKKTSSSLSLNNCNDCFGQIVLNLWYKKVWREAKWFYGCVVRSFHLQQNISSSLRDTKEEIYEHKRN